jgi:hypothetical protein
MCVILALFALLVSPLITIAEAQTGAPPLFNLSGIWELHEYGDRQHNAATPLVEIAHAGNTVTANFIRGSECFNQQARSTAFIGQLGGVQPTTPPSLAMTAHSMSVCSNDRALVNKCGGAIKAIYTTTAPYATAEPDFIQGSRVTQGVNGCTPDPSQNGTARFWLRRLTPCEYEQRLLRDAEDEMLRLYKSIADAKPVFQAAIDMARTRFGESYRSQPITVMEYPSQVVSLDVNAANAQALFAAIPGVFESGEWTEAARMVIAMAQENPPVVPAMRMLDEMTRIERLGPEAQRAVAAYQRAAEAERKCRTQP